MEYRPISLRTIPGRSITGRFIPEREKQLAHVPVEDVLDDLGISYCCHNTRA